MGHGEGETSNDEGQRERAVEGSVVQSLMTLRLLCAFNNFTGNYRGNFRRRLGLRWLAHLGGRM